MRIRSFTAPCVCGRSVGLLQNDGQSRSQSTERQAGHTQKANATKLRGEEVAHAVKATLEMDDYGFTPELSIFAINPVG